MRSVRMSELKARNEPDPDFDTGCFSLRYFTTYIVGIGGLLSSALLICIQPSIVPWRKFDFIRCDRNSTNFDEHVDLKLRTEENLKTTIHLWAQILMCLPSMWITQRYGGKYIMEYSICFGGILSLLIPTAIEASYLSFMVLRFVIGLILALARPAMIIIAINWIPIDEKNYMTTLLISGDILSYAVVPPITAHFSNIDKDKSWALVFYIFGVLSITWSIVCMWHVTEIPSKNKWVSKNEKEILESKSLCENCRRKFIPWKQLIKSKALVALLCASLFLNISWSIMQMVMPSLIIGILDLTIQNTANTMILLFALQFVTALICSLIADWAVGKKPSSATKIRKLAVLISHLIIGTCFIILATSNCHYWFSILLVGIIITSAGINKIGIYINFIDLAPPYAGSIFALCTSVQALGYIITVHIISDYFRQSMFYIATGSILISSAIFLAFGSGKKLPLSNSSL